MTLVHGAAAHAGGPQTHVLIIGVGRYIHLSGGAGPVNVTLPLGQLTSPPISARAVADWFAGAYSNAGAPLGSVELLLSDATTQDYQVNGAGPTRKIDPATFANIEQAFNDWDARCNADRDNIAFFYFCGHGLQKEMTVLLPEDFGANPNNLWSRAIDFTRTFRGMACNQAQTQYYVVDACRQWTTSLLKELDMAGETLKTFSFGKQKQRTAPILYATANGLPAFGDSGKRSRMTDALLKCLDGSGADKQGGLWVIDTDHLGAAVKKLVELQNKALYPVDPQIVDPVIFENSAGTRVLHKLAPGKDPSVVVSLECLPDAATGSAKFYYVRQGQPKSAPSIGPWLAEIPAGVYDFGVEFQDGTYKAEPIKEEFVRPPVWPLKITAMTTASPPPEG